jgi:beta-N-acetylhexosaminidase
LDKQDLLEKVGQMFVVGFPGQNVVEGLKKLIHDYRVGNIILFGRNIGTPNQVLELTSKLQEEAKAAGHTHPLLISVDQENGVVRRIKDQVTLFPGAMSLGAAGDTELAKEVGLATGKELRNLGINWNLAPVLDVNNNPDNPVINVRSFGEDPHKVGDLGVSWMKGVQEAGVATTLKHFPGHGDTDVDSHLDLPSINHSLERLFEVELVPFIQGIKSGADVIMTAHIYFSTLEQEYGRPATLSKNVLNGLLRNQLGFNGVITTDCLEMNAISKTVGVANGALQAAIAGADLLMVSHTFDYQVEAVNKLLDAGLNGGININRIIESSDRILALKEKYSGSNITTSFDPEEHHALAKRAYRESISVIKEKTLPLENRESGKTFALFTSQKPLLQVAERGEKLALPDILNGYERPIDYLELKSDVDPKTQLADIKSQLKGDEQLLIFTLTLKPGDPVTEIVQELVKDYHATVISLRNPYDYKLLSEADNFICAYDDTPYAIQAALDVVFGKQKATGKVPVTL